MSLWTPDGEIPVSRRRSDAGSSAAPPPPETGAEGPSVGDPLADGVAGVVGAPSLDDLSPDERAQFEQAVHQMAEVQKQIAATPAAQLVATHVAGFYELAAIKLGQSKPMFADAQLAIDAMAAVLDAVGDRLGEDVGPLREALTQLQMAFVRLKSQHG